MTRSSANSLLNVDRTSTAGPPSIEARATAGSCWALLLAAGESRRFGGGKLLAPLLGRSLVAYVLETIEQARSEGVLAGGLTVAPAGEIGLIEAIRASGLRCVENDDPRAGLARSIQLGLEALTAVDVAPPAGAAMVFLADQPAVRPQVASALVAAWRAGAGSVLRPRYALSPRQPGHPVLLDRSVWQFAGSLRGDVGFGPLLRDLGGEVMELDVAGCNPSVETQADLAALERELERL